MLWSTLSTHSLRRSQEGCDPWYSRPVEPRANGRHHLYDVTVEPGGFAEAGVGCGLEATINPKGDAFPTPSPEQLPN